MQKFNITRHINFLATIVWKNVLEYVRYPMEIVLTFFMPIVWFLPTYLMIISFAPDGKSVGLASWIGSNNFFHFYLIGILSSFFVYTIFWNMGFALKRLMDIGLLETIWVCPISKVLYLVGESLFSMLRLVYEIGAMLVVFRYVFKITLPAEFISMLPLFIPFILLMYGFGIAFAALVLLVKDANMMIDASAFIVDTVTGASTPLKVFPKGILVLSMAVPVTYFLDILRVRILNIQPFLNFNFEVFAFLASSIAFPFIGVKLFRLIDRKCRRDGTIHIH